MLISGYPSAQDQILKRFIRFSASKGTQLKEVDRRFCQGKKESVSQSLKRQNTYANYQTEGAEGNSERGEGWDHENN
jgi:hypothetical protein